MKGGDTDRGMVADCAIDRLVDSGCERGALFDDDEDDRAFDQEGESG